MKKNIFKDAKFGDKFLTRNGKIVIYWGYKTPVGRDITWHYLISDDTDLALYCTDDGLAVGNHTDFPEWDEDVVSKYHEPIDDESIYFWLRNKTGCGLYDAKNFISQLIKAMQHKPIFKTDSTLKLIYEEPIDEEKLDELAGEYAWKNGDSLTNCTELNKAFKEGYKKAKEE